ncbi:DUF2062 domain-containing protein [Bartonella sp. A05]|uniref:DUF2062 domain-containing protein n=1 Tax=Bartonella sp. A05 TaxID=2967261 RepID=UPI0022A9F05E|nr:DUF2062 domain-containing protein [Bartonella sp. A05]MCZ2203817.1 DUF2062 domain-containing protein [Bartonella sp. A05]
MLFRHRKPVDFGERIRLLFWPRCSFSRSLSYMRKRILRISETPHKIALGFAIGVFLACSPLFGLHIFLAVFFSWVLRGNFAAAIIGTVLSNPLTFFLIIMADYKIGILCLSFLGYVNEVSLSQVYMMFDDLTLLNIRQIFKGTWDSIMMPMILGGILLGFVLGSLSYLSIHRAISRFQQNRYKKISKNKKKIPLQKENSSGVL